MPMLMPAITAATQAKGRRVAPSVPSLFPLVASSNGRYLQGSNGVPFICIGDTPWSLPSNCTNVQTDPTSRIVERIGVSQ